MTAGRTRHRVKTVLTQLFFLLVVFVDSSAPALTNGYSAGVTLDLSRVPFSRYGSYLALSHLPNGPIGAGLYLRSVHRGVKPEITLLELMRGGKSVPFREVATPTLLRLEAGGGYVEICISEPYLLRLRGRGLGLRFSKPPANSGFAFARSKSQWEFNAAEQDIKLMLSSQQGRIAGDAHWDGGNDTALTIDFAPYDPNGEFEGTIEEFRSSWHERRNPSTFQEAQQTVALEYRNWLAKMPVVPSEFQTAANLAAYVDWSAVVAPEGYLTRPAMLMSKNWMNSVWSWDHCFNAMLLSDLDPSLAWDQLMLPFARQNSEGGLPDGLSDRQVTWAYSKPPIHGWAIQWMMAHGASISLQRLAEVYEPLARWTDWYFQYRDDDQDGLPQYEHGNDSGWDNSTVFRTSPAVETPDLASFLVLQMEALADIAHRLGRERESTQWKHRSDKLRQTLLQTFWREDHFVALRSADHSVAESNSLLLYLPIVLGHRLPPQVKARLIERLRHGGFLTQNGLASERLSSDYYEPDGYWRGPIWAPTTMIIAEGLDDAGEKSLAKELRLKYCRMAARSGMAENFNAVTGEGLRDPAYTWSASVFLIFAHRLMEN